jgi:hypothetical protein
VLQTRFSNPKLGNPVRNGAEWRAGKGDQLWFFVSSEKKIGMGQVNQVNLLHYQIFGK